MGTRGQVTSKDLLTAPVMSMSYWERKTSFAQEHDFLLWLLQGSVRGELVSEHLYMTELAGLNLWCAFRYNLNLKHYETIKQVLRSAVKYSFFLQWLFWYLFLGTVTKFFKNNFLVPLICRRLDCVFILSPGYLSTGKMVFLSPQGSCW